VVLTSLIDRRRFLSSTGIALLSELAPTDTQSVGSRTRTNASDQVSLFLCGDVMTARGVDQILPRPGEPHLRESYLRSAIEYVKLAERASGPIPRPVGFDYIWGDALAEWERVRPDLRIANLETAVTDRGVAAANKGIHYHMHPQNVPCLSEAGFDCVVLANNHVTDFGCAGLEQTLETLQRVGIRTAGAGRDAEEAAVPAIIELPDRGRVLVLAWGTASSGVWGESSAGKDRCGVNLLPDLSKKTATSIARQVRAVRQPRDIVVASLHWGGNWGFDVFEDERNFAHWLIEIAGADIVYGHSSHHVKGIEVYGERLILYGCGDFLNDYEGIVGHEEFRADLGLMYFPTINLASGKLESLVLTPTQVRKMRVIRAAEEGRSWLSKTLNREGDALGTRVANTPDGGLRLVWR
jgi:poly-gamma-glutamate synthesis protein (capsule biosynthesis protein)